MADVTEVIHRISYEINDSALANATRAIQLQLTELQKLSNQLDKYNSQLINAANTNAESLEQLGRKIESVSRRMAETAGKSKILLEETFKGIIQGLTGRSGLSDAVGSYVKGVIAEFNKLQSTGKSTGIGFAQHLKTVGASGASVVTTLSNLAKSALSFTGVFGIALNVLTLFSDELFGAKENAEGLGEAIDEAAEFSKAMGQESANEIGQLLVLKEKIEDTTTSYNERKSAIDKLREQYPAYFDNLSDEELMAGKVAGAYQKVVKAIIASAQARVMVRQLETKIAGANEAADEIRRVARENGITIKEDVDPETAFMKFDLAEKEKAVAQRKLLYGNNYGRGAFSDNVANRQIHVKGAVPDDSANHDAISQLAASINAYNSLLQQISAMGETVARLQGQAQTGNSGSGNSSEKQRVQSGRRREQKPLEFLPTTGPKQLPAKREEFHPEKVDEKAPDPDEEKKKINVKEVLDPFKKLSGERRKGIADQIKDYQQLAQAAADAYNSILQTQIDALDKEISLREKRVEEAKKLAERGNTEALRLEEERLRKAQQQREQFARRQQAVNAAITVSNAIAAVARAALEGGGFGSIATIAALIAALAAGYAAVTSLSNDSGDSFADGVIDYKGKGGPRDDKNWVRISTGESVITAEGTKKNRALLEAINNGAALHMVNPALPLMIPEFKQPVANTANGFASTADLKRLEGKLDEVVGAIEDNKMKQNIFFNEQGVGIMTERAIQKDRRRWK